MGTVTSGVGLVSGLDFQSIIDQLIAIDARPREQVASRIGRIDAQRTAYLDINARINALLSNVNNLIRPSTFRTSSVASSAEGVLRATADSSAQPGSQSFIVQALASTHQLVTRGFAARNEPINAQSITVESAAARVNRATQLSELNGQQGVPRGSIEITASDGAKKTVSLSDAQTLNDVVVFINGT
ncbi:MAG: flagellar cap protein FliD N-terminal domain-containing protein, partial [Phycisphaerae bacterium]